MHGLRRARRRYAGDHAVRSAPILPQRLACAALATLVLAGGLVVMVANPAAAAQRAAGACNPYIDGSVIPVPCVSGSGTGGSAGATGASGGSAVRNTCVFVSLSPAQAQGLGLATPPPGEVWALLDCLGGAIGSGPQAVLVSVATGLPEVTPQQLMIQALGELRVPSLRPATAPPLGSDGLVGLPQWFWVPAASWYPRSVTVRAGPVWATVTATPDGMTVRPGAGIGPVTCPGPGTAYDPAKPASDQHTDCSYTYAQPSAGLPGNAYQASVAVTWRVGWAGSGGAGGVLTAALSIPADLTIQVAQGEALVTSP